MKREQEIFPYIAHLLNGAEVEWKPLGEVAELKRGTSITKKTSNEGEIPVISGGQQPAYYIDQFNREGKTITVAGSGAYAGHVMYWEEPIFVGDAFSVKTDETILSTKYVYHFLLKNQQKIYAMKKGSGVPHVYPKDLGVLEIPVPPLSVQQEIVRILDKFTQLEAELEAELDCRKRQYEYYRDKLLSFNEVVGGAKTLIFSNLQWKTLGEVATYVRGLTYNKTNESDEKEGGYKVLRANNINLSSNTLNFDNVKVVKFDTKVKDNQKLYRNDILISAASGSKEHVGKVAFIYEDLDYYFGGFMGVVRCSDKIIPRFLFHILTDNLFKTYLEEVLNSSTINNLNSKIMNMFQIPIPPIEEQERIAGILDKFDTLVNSISEGLPREIELRRKQYEYYREKLLSFPKN